MFHGRNKTNQENVLSWVRLKIPAIMSLHAFFCPLWKMHEPAAVAGNSSPVKKSIGQLASAALVRRGAVLHRSRLGLCQFGWVWSTVCVSLEVNAEVMVFDLGCLLSDWFGELLSRQKHSGLVFNQLMSWVILIWAMWSENATWLSIDWGGLKNEMYGWVMLEKERVAVWTSTAQLIDLQGALYLRKY